MKNRDKRSEICMMCEHETRHLFYDRPFFGDNNQPMDIHHKPFVEPLEIINKIRENSEDLLHQQVSLVRGFFRPTVTLTSTEDLNCPKPTTATTVELNERN